MTRRPMLMLALASLFACGGRALGDADGGDETSTTGTEETETGDGGETGDEPPPQTGEVLWCVVWDESFQDDIPVEVELDSKGNIVVAGVANAHPYYNEAERWVAKFDPEGQHLWSFRAGEEGEREDLRDLEITSDDGIVVLGTQSQGGVFAPYLARFSPQGDEDWLYTDAVPTLALTAMINDEADELTVFGAQATDDPMMGAPMVWKIDALDGAVLEYEPWSDPGKQAIALAWAGEKLWAAGESFQGMPPGPFERNAWLARFDSLPPGPVTEGASLAYLPEGHDATATADVAVAPDGTVWVTGVGWAGVPPEPPSAFDGWLMHFDANAELLEEVVLSQGSDRPDGGTYLAFDPWDNLVVAGNAFGQGYVAKRSLAGDVLWTQTLQLDFSPVSSTINAVALDPEGNIILVGSATAEGEFANAVICKLTP